MLRTRVNGRSWVLLAHSPVLSFRNANTAPTPESIPAAFFALYVASIAAALAGVFRIGRWCGGPWAGALALLIAIPVRNSIANEALYRVQFSHSHVASAVVIWAIVWFLEGRRLRPREVLLGPSNADYVVVERGLRAGERVALRDPTAPSSDFGSAP